MKPPSGTEPGKGRGGLIDRDALVRGETGAVEAFVKGSIDRIHSLLFRMLGHPEEAQDLTQEVYIRAFRSLPAYRGEAAPETWLYRIALNVGRDAIARRMSERAREGGEIEPNGHASRIPDPADLAVRGEERATLEEALSALGEERREIVILSDIEGLSTQEIAAALEIPAGTVKSRLHRAREALREEVRKRTEIPA